MHRKLVFLVVLLFPAVVAAEPPDSGIGIQSRIRKVIESAEASVVAVVVSRTPYEGQSPEDVARGRLGSYTPPDPFRSRRGFALQIPPEIKKLDLSDPANVANNQFGSGLVLSENGHVLTNYHLVDGATKVYVRGAGGKGSYANIYAADSRSDLAVLKLLAPPDGLKPVRFAEARFVDGPGDAKATVRKGDFVVVVAHAQAAGFPDGSPSASFGIVGNVGRRTLSQSVSDADRIMQPLYKLGSLLHTDARLTVGVSGGAVLNLNGEVIGVTSSVAAVAGSEAAGGYAIPMDANYRRIVESLKGGKEVEYGFLGVSTDPVASGIGGGAVLSQVTPGTPADKAGLRGGELGRMNADRIIAVDGHPVQDMDDLFLNIGAALAGSDVVVTVNRNGRTQDLTVRLAKFRNPQPWIASVRPAAVFGLHVDYTSVLLQDLIQAQDRMAGNAALPRGVVIRDVKPNSPAERELKRGGEDLSKWVITSVNDRAISIPSEFYAAARGKAVVRLKMIHTADPSRTREVTLK